MAREDEGYGPRSLEEQAFRLAPASCTFDVLNVCLAACTFALSSAGSQHGIVFRCGTATARSYALP